SRRRRYRCRLSCPRGAPATRRRPRRAGLPEAKGSAGRPCASTLPMAEVVSLRKRRAHLRLARSLAGQRREGDELVHDHVPVPLEALEAAACEEKRLAADERTKTLVHLRRDDEVHLAELVLEEHEDDAVRGRRALPRDDEARHRDPTPVLQV